MGVRITASLVKDANRLYNPDLIGIDLTEEPTDKEIQLVGFLNGFILSDRTSIHLGWFFRPIWKALETLKMEADMEVRFNNGNVIINLKEV